MRPPPDRERPRHPSGGRKAKRAYAAQPYLGPRDAGFYGLLWAAGLAAASGGASLRILLALGALWAAWLFLAWRLSCWLRAQEDFDSAAADAMASPSAGLLLGWVLPGLGGLGGLIATRGQLWWEPLIWAGLSGMALNAAAAFLERSFRLASFWALVGLAGGLGHPAPLAGLGTLAAALGLGYLVVTAAQARAFRHFPEGPVPPERHLLNDLKTPCAAFALALLLAWGWTPALTPKPVQILPRTNLSIWLPGERRGMPTLPLFGKPPLNKLGGVESSPTEVSEGTGELLKAVLSGGGGTLAAAAALGALVLGWLWWRKLKKRAAAKELAEAQRKQALRGAGVVPRKKAPAGPPPEDPREAVVYWYNRLRSELAGAGIPRQAALTPAEYARALSQRGVFSEGSVQGLTELFHKAEYSPHPVVGEDLQKAKTWYEGISAKAYSTSSQPEIPGPPGGS